MSTPSPGLTLASASGNLFAYVWEDEVPDAFDGPRWARALCPRSTGLGLDGLFLVRRPASGPWILEHWEPDGARTFCSNGSRAAMALPGAPAGARVDVLSSGAAIELRRAGRTIGIRMPEGEECGLRPSPLGPEDRQIQGWIGNPQLVLQVEDVAAVDLPSFAPPLRHHPAFPEGVNVSVLQVLAPGRARIRTFERGVEGETLCCGTGCATAGAWLAHRTGVSRWILEPAGPDPVEVEVRMGPGGTWRELWLSGPVRVLGRFTPGEDAPWNP